MPSNRQESQRTGNDAIDWDKKPTTGGKKLPRGRKTELPRRPGTAYTLAKRYWHEQTQMAQGLLGIKIKGNR